MEAIKGVAKCRHLFDSERELAMDPVNNGRIVDRVTT